MSNPNHIQTPRPNAAPFGAPASTSASGAPNANGHASAALTQHPGTARLPLWPQPDLHTQWVFANRDVLADPSHQGRFQSLIAHAEQQHAAGSRHMAAGPEAGQISYPLLIAARQALLNSEWGGDLSPRAEQMMHLPHYCQLVLLHIANDDLPAALGNWAKIEAAAPYLTNGHAASASGLPAVPSISREVLDCFNQVRPIFEQSSRTQEMQVISGIY